MARPGVQAALKKLESWDPEQPEDPESGKNAAVGALAGPAPGLQAQWVQPAPGAGSGPAPVLVVPNNHLAVQLLLLLFECILHLLPLQTTIPDETKAQVRFPAPVAQPTHQAAQTQRKTCRNQSPPWLSHLNELRNWLWILGIQAFYLKTLILAQGQNSPLLFKVLCNCLSLPRREKFFLLAHSSPPYTR